SRSQQVVLRYHDKVDISSSPVSAGQINAVSVDAKLREIEGLPKLERLPPLCGIGCVGYGKQIGVGIVARASCEIHCGCIPALAFRIIEYAGIESARLRHACG